MDNALLLVVGYTDRRGSEDYNQELSEKRAGRVVNYLQQKLRLEALPHADADRHGRSRPGGGQLHAEGKAQNRRVAVNILVSKAVDNL